MEELWSLLQDQKILLVLGLVAIAMMIDFLSGCYLAWRSHTISSKVGINGIIRKAASLILLVFLLPVAFLLPTEIGSGILSVFYLGYLLMEIQSILENYQKIGIDIKIFQLFLNMFEKNKPK